MDRARWALQEQVPVKCHGLGGRSTMLDGLYGNVFDHHSVVYEFPNNVRVYALCRTTTGCYDEYSSLLFGTKGKAEVNAGRIEAGGEPWRPGSRGCARSPRSPSCPAARRPCPAWRPARA